MSVPKAFEYLRAMNEKGASDLYLTKGYPPTLRVENSMSHIHEEAMTPEEISEIMGEILTTKQQRDFDIANELNTSLDMGPMGRYRVNVLRQRQTPALVIRRIISKIPSFEELHLPPILERLAVERRGLVLVTGMTGSGKSTTLAAMLDYRNQHEDGHMITIEDPIEYYHEHKKSVITQREIGVDTESYSTAMKNALRQRPDVILVGEIREREVMEQALTISETGHLCLATLHTNNAYQAIERIVNFFPEEFHNQVRLNLSMNLKAIISQRLIPSLKGGLVPALEIMINEGLIREVIHEGKYEKITEVMEQSTAMGMSTFDQSLLRLYMEELISEETALAQSDRPTDMRVKIQQAKISIHAGGLHDVDTSVLSISD